MKLTVEILQSLSNDLDRFWIDWIISSAQSAASGVGSLLNSNRMGKSNQEWEWISNGSASNSVLYLIGNTWKWVIYGAKSSKTQQEIFRFGSLMIYLISHDALEAALYTDCENEVSETFVARFIDYKSTVDPKFYKEEFIKDLFLQKLKGSYNTIWWRRCLLTDSRNFRVK